MFVNPLRTRFICVIQGLSAYRAVNTLHFSYKDQSVNEIRITEKLLFVLGAIQNA